MNEGDDLEKHIQNARQILNELNIALIAEGATHINELEFIHQFLASLPESWSVLISVIDQTPDATNANGVQLCQCILSRLLTEWHRRKAAGTANQIPTTFWDISYENAANPAEAHTGEETPMQVKISTIEDHLEVETTHEDEDAQANLATQGPTSYDPKIAFAFQCPIIPPLLGPPREPYGYTINELNKPEHNEILSKFDPTKAKINGQSLIQYGFAMDDTWIIDSGASCHVTNCQEHLTNFKEFYSSVLGIGGQAEIAGMGQVTLNISPFKPQQSKGKFKWISTNPKEEQVILQNVALVPDSPVNLISLSAWTDQFPKDRIVTEQKVMLFERYNNLSKEWEAYAIAHKIGDMHIWQLLHLGKNLTISGSLDPKNLADCLGCIKGKSTIQPFPKGQSEPVKNIGNLFYSDVWGPAHTTSLQGNSYFITFIDAYSHFTFVYFMKHKNEAVNKYISLCTFLATQKNLKIKRIHFDNGKEMINKHLKEFCNIHGTEITTTAPYSSQQNGPAKCKNCTFAEGACAMLHGHSNMCNMPFLWQEAIAYKHLPNPAAPYTAPPLGHSSEVSSEDLGEEWFDVEVLSEGEMGIEIKPHIPKNSSTPTENTPMHTSTPMSPAKASTQCSHTPEDKEEDQQMPPRTPAPLPTTPPKSTSMPASCHSPHSSSGTPYHRPPSPKAPKKPIVPRFMRSRAAAGTPMNREANAKQTCPFDQANIRNLSTG
ncbi:hypothetical protein OPQ81_004958 [Rhizoctonia solani]|nr:hypothetical protein OPQ81_004958 [Rhizoctonia solani]